MTGDPETVGNYLIPTEIIFLIFAFGPFALRLYGRLILRRNAGWDDLYISLAFVCAVIITVTHILSLGWGLGRHYVDLVRELKPKLWLTEFIQEWVFPAGTYFTKLSILCFYLRFADGASVRLQKAIYATMIFLTIWMLAFSIAVSCSCSPIRKWWDTDVPGTCWPNLYIGIVLFMQIMLNTLSDVIIFALPIKTVWKIRVPRAQKLRMIALLGLGLVICIVSLVRIKFVLMFLIDANDNSWYAYALYVSIAVEMDLSITAACLPFCRPAARKILPEVKRFTSTGSSKAISTIAIINSGRVKGTRVSEFEQQDRRLESRQQQCRETRHSIRSEDEFSNPDSEQYHVGDSPGSSRKILHPSAFWDVEMGTWRSRDDDGAMASRSRTIRGQEIMSFESLERAMKKDGIM